MNTAPQIVTVKGARPLHLKNRVAEQLEVGANAWVSFDGRKALPVTIIGIDDRHYDVCMLRSSKRVIRPGSIHSLFLDEVRSTPEEACRNCVTT